MAPVPGELHMQSHSNSNDRHLLCRLLGVLQHGRRRLRRRRLSVRLRVWHQLPARDACSCNMTFLTPNLVNTNSGGPQANEAMPGKPRRACSFQLDTRGFWPCKEVFTVIKGGRAVGGVWLPALGALLLLLLRRRSRRLLPPLRRRLHRRHGCRWLLIRWRQRRRRLLLLLPLGRRLHRRRRPCLLCGTRLRRWPRRSLGARLQQLQRLRRARTKQPGLEAGHISTLKLICIASDDQRPDALCSQAQAPMTPHSSRVQAPVKPRYTPNVHVSTRAVSDFVHVEG